jgi:hypothetical protein
MIEVRRQAHAVAQDVGVALLDFHGKRGLGQPKRELQCRAGGRSCGVAQVSSCP